MCNPEVYTRRLCDVQECKQGRVSTGNAKLPWEYCNNCNGKGYVVEWLDLRTLIKDLMK